MGYWVIQPGKQLIAIEKNAVGETLEQAYTRFANAQDLPNTLS